jgi:hypothetical protein
VTILKCNRVNTMTLVDRGLHEGPRAATGSRIERERQGRSHRHRKRAPIQAFVSRSLSQRSGEPAAHAELEASTSRVEGSRTHDRPRTGRPHSGVRTDDLGRTVAGMRSTALYRLDLVPPARTDVCSPHGASAFGRSPRHLGLEVRRSRGPAGSIMRGIMVAGSPDLLCPGTVGGAAAAKVKWCGDPERAGGLCRQ